MEGVYSVQVHTHTPDDVEGGLIQVRLLKIAAFEEKGKQF